MPFFEILHVNSILYRSLELLSLVTSKWGQLYQSYKEGRQTLMEKYLEPISRGNSDTNDAPQN